MSVNVRNTFIAVGLCLSLAVPMLAQEPVTITGKVTSDAGQALGQVEVAIPSMGLGGLSRDDGSFTVVIAGARVSGQTVLLLARRLGYKSQTAQVTLLPVREIEWIDAEGDHVRIHAGKTWHLLRETMRNLEDQLDGSTFAASARCWGITNRCL